MNGVERHTEGFPDVLSHSWLPFRPPESPPRNAAGSEPGWQFSSKHPSREEDTNFSASSPAFLWTNSSPLLWGGIYPFCPVVPLFWTGKSGNSTPSYWVREESSFWSIEVQQLCSSFSWAHLLEWCFHPLRYFHCNGLQSPLELEGFPPNLL